MITVKPQRTHLYTPLRYPGGKTSLFTFFDEVIEYNELSHVKYIEPYAGGAGAALCLLMLNKVESIVINDYDEAIYAFWKSITEQPKLFIRKIETTPLTVNEWRKQSAIYKNKVDDYLQLGFATFYLNRTNRSGILSAGVIGGINQLGKWKIGARYNKDSLTQKISAIAAEAEKGRIEVLHEDGLAVIDKYRKDERALFYIDPPYYDKGASLYLNSYNHDDHEKLASLLNQYAKSMNWMLTYDNVEPILKLYEARKNKEAFILNYQAHSSRKGSEIMIFSDNLKRPE